MRLPVTDRDIFGLVKPTIDAHTLGISNVRQLLNDCGIKVIVADAAIAQAVSDPAKIDNINRLEQWLRESRITRLGFSYRLDPQIGRKIFGHLVYQLREKQLLQAQGGPISGLYFVGLPEASLLVKCDHGDLVEVFFGDETPGETLNKLGIIPSAMSHKMSEDISYDDSRLQFGRELIRSEKHLQIKPVDRSGYEGFGASHDHIMSRLRHAIKQGLPPLIRAHVGPYLANRSEAFHQFLDWVRQLAQAGFLDVLSIGTSQLSQSHFGEDWTDKSDGGGVPINSPSEFRAVWDAARPMLVRTYAGTRNLLQLAKMYEETINIAWHALSLWWFCQIDGRGPYPVRTNLEQHLETLRFIAASNKPFEANVPHHFAFRGADDVTYIVSAVLAARTAKAAGVRYFILQNMLNTPKSTWGIHDLAKSRALLSMIRQLEDKNFQVILQPRAGLDYFSHDLEKAKIQLAAVSALMDDIEPHDATSPPIVHVVSYSEASHLANPPIINESIKITRAAIKAYRKFRRRDNILDMSAHTDVQRRMEELLSESKTILAAIDSIIPAPYTASGLYSILAAGFLPVPYLWACRDEFVRAIKWRTRLVNGSVKVVDENDRIIPAQERVQAIRQSLLLTGDS